MNDTKVVRFDPNLTQIVYHGDTHTRYVAEMLERYEGTYVTHADYRALEERYETLWEVQALTTQKLNEAQEELAALRVRVGDAEDEAVRSTKSLMSLAARTALLFDASKIAMNELQSCQSVIHLHGGFDPAYVEGAQKAMRDLSAALEALK